MKRINLLIIVLCAMVMTMLFASCQKANELQANAVGLAVYNNMAKVSFIAYSEINVSHYVVQLSKDGANWVDRGMLISQDSSVHKYTINVSTQDILITSPGKYYTRIKSVDLDGQVMFSPVMSTTAK